MRGCQERNRSPATRRFGGGLREPRRRWGGGQALGRRRWRGPPARPWLRLSLLFFGPSCPVCPPRLRPLRLGEDAATHVALEVGPRTLRRLSGCPLAAPTPWGSPLRPPGVPPSAASAPAPPPRPCVRSRLSLAHSHPPHPPTPVPLALPPPASVSVCLSVWVTSEAGGLCVCVPEGRKTACRGDCSPLPRLATSRRPPPRSPTLKYRQKHTAYTHAPPHFPGIPLNTPGA